VIEIMINSPAIKQLIEKGDIAGIQKSIESSQSYYRMQSFNQALSELVRKRVITEEDAMANTTAPGDLKLMLKGMGRAGGTSMIHKDEVEGAPKEGEKPEDAAKADPSRSGAVPKLVLPPVGSGGQALRPGTGAPGSLRAPLRPTGRQGTPAAQRPQTGANPAVPRPQPGAAPPGAAPPSEPPAEGGQKPKIQRGFDFS
jgi:hypothetical protein